MAEVAPEPGGRVEPGALPGEPGDDAQAGLPATEPPTVPVLRLETGMHTATIRRIATDAAGRVLLTASNDKTARLWDVASGQLLHTLRPPQGEGREGQILACALSPDGRLAALGGSTGYQWDGSSSIYLFDAATGQFLRRIPGLPARTIHHLVFSRDGSCLGSVPERPAGHQRVRNGRDRGLPARRRPRNVQGLQLLGA